MRAARVSKIASLSNTLRRSMARDMNRRRRGERPIMHSHVRPALKRSACDKMLELGKNLPITKIVRINPGAKRIYGDVPEFDFGS